MLIVAVVPHAKVAIPTQHALMGRIGYTPSVRSNTSHSHLTTHPNMDDAGIKGVTQSA